MEAHLRIDGSPSAWEDTLASALAELQPQRSCSRGVLLLRRSLGGSFCVSSMSCASRSRWPAVRNAMRRALWSAAAGAGCQARALGPRRAAHWAVTRLPSPNPFRRPSCAQWRDGPRRYGSIPVARSRVPGVFGEADGCGGVAPDGPTTFDGDMDRQGGRHRLYYRYISHNT